MINRNKTKKVLNLTLKVVISVLIALEISIPPNPYKEELILLLVISIVLKHDIVEKILKRYNKIISWVREQSQIGTIR